MNIAVKNKDMNAKLMEKEKKAELHDIIRLAKAGFYLFKQRIKCSRNGILLSDAVIECEQCLLNRSCEIRTVKVDIQ